VLAQGEPKTRFCIDESPAADLLVPTKSSPAKLEDIQALRECPSNEN
jgi:hypothetical protein